MTEDAFIDFRVIHNILSGFGPVFNPGERVEVYTDPLWLALLTVVSGIFRFVSVEWWSVLLGLGFTVAGFALASVGAAGLSRDVGEKRYWPLGLLAMSVVEGTWMFATSGLETGMIFGWLGLSWWLLVRVRRGQSGYLVTAFVLSLGFTIRPDMAIYTVTLGAALLLLVRQGTERTPRRTVAKVVGALVAIPLASELFRMAYFGLLVPNTAIAKSAGGTWWNQGFDYLMDSVVPYRLYVPVVLLAVIGVLRVQVWRRERQHTALLLVVAMALGGLLDLLYVVKVGGDFMHARFLLPGFFGLATVSWVAPSWRQLSLREVFTVASCLWIVGCLGVFRDQYPWMDPHGIANERGFWLHDSGHQHPIALSDYRNDINDEFDAGVRAQRLASQTPKGTQRLVYDIHHRPLTVTVAASSLPERVFVGMGNIGIAGLRSGSDVYIFDILSLANPIGSHFTLLKRGRPGHEKVVTLDWMAARFATATSALPTGTSAAQVADARAALHCGPLASYLHTIDQPLSWSTMWSDVTHAVTWTTMSFSATPAIARQQLCGSTTR